MDCSPGCAAITTITTTGDGGASEAAIHTASGARLLLSNLPWLCACVLNTVFIVLDCYSGVKEIYTTWIELLDEGAGLFHFMTGNLSENGVTFHEKVTYTNLSASIV